MPSVSKSSPENSRPEACYFPITQSISKYFDPFCMGACYFPITQSIFKYLTHFVREKVWILRNLNFLDESEHSKHFLKKKNLENFSGLTGKFSGLTGKFSGLTGKFSARRTCTYFLYWKMTSASVVSSTSGEKSMVCTINHVCIVQLSFNDRYFILYFHLHLVPIATLL